MTSIGAYAFGDCTSLTSVIIPDSVTSIYEGAFRGCTSLTNITIGNSVTSIEHGAFGGCTSLTSVTIPDSVTSIGAYAFRGCTSLTTVIIPDSVTSIEGMAFERCSSLTSITIPDSVISIGNSAFRGCTGLTGVYFEGNAPSFGRRVFENCPVSIVYYRAEATGWGQTFGGRPTALWITQPPSAELQMVGSYDTSGRASDVAVSDNYAYVADGEAGLQVIDISDPIHPRRVGGLNTIGDAQAVSISDSHAYVADGPAGLQVIDISDSISPVRVNGIDTGGNAIDVTVSGDYAYVAAVDAGLVIIDISESTGPRKAGEFRAALDAVAVEVVNDYCFIVQNEGGNGESALQIVDISDPTEPQAVGIETGYGWNSIAVSGQYAYVAYETPDSGPVATGVEVIDISDAANPARVGVIESEDSVTAVTTSGGYAYAATSGGLMTIDVANPTDTTLFATSSAFESLDVTIDGAKIFLAAGFDGLIILDRSKPLRIGPASIDENGNIQLPLTGENGRRVRVQRSVNLVDWEDWKTITLSEEGCALIRNGNLKSRCFYRAIDNGAQASE